MNQLTKTTAAPGTEAQSLLPADPMVSMIERVAMDPNVPIERLERMMEMKYEMEAKEAERDFAAAFAAMQQEIPVIPERGKIKNRNGEVQSTYPLWEDVIAALREPMAKHGFSMSFDRRKEEGVTYYGCILTHAMGHSRRAEIDLPRDTSGSKNDVQGEGSSVSYGQRYSSKMAINWTSEGTQDDDGVAAGAGQTITEEQFSELKGMIERIGIDESLILTAEKIQALELLPASKFMSVRKNLKITAEKRGVKL